MTASFDEVSRDLQAIVDRATVLGMLGADEPVEIDVAGQLVQLISDVSVLAAVVKVLVDERRDS